MPRTDKIEVFRSKADRQWYFRFRRSNGGKIYQSEGYRRPGVCISTAEFVSAGVFPVVVLEGDQ